MHTQRLMVPHVLAAFLALAGLGACTQVNSPQDSGATGADAALAAQPDGGQHVADAGLPHDDAGASLTDAGTARSDAAVSVPDAGPGADAGTDAGPADASVGTDGSTDAGTPAADGGALPDASQPDAAAAPDAAMPAPDAGLPCQALAHDLGGLNDFQEAPGVTIYPAFPAAYGVGARRVRVMVPPGAGPFPVLYAHDGQNLMHAGESAFGQAWELDDAAADMWAEGFPFIIVAMDNTAARMDDYTPVSDPTYGGGNGDAYLRWVLDHLKPVMDYRYPTACGASDTAMMGSSLGGLISFHAARTRWQVVGRVAALSPSFWWNNRWTVSQYNAQTTANPVMLWMDAGSDEGGTVNGGGGILSVVADNRAVASRALALGHVFGVDLGYQEAERDEHNEAAWRRRLRAVLHFLMAPPHGTPQHGYVWAYTNPVAPGAASSAILQVAWDDGLLMTAPPGVAAFSGGATGLLTVGPQGSLGAASGAANGTASITAQYGGFSGLGQVDVRSNPAAEVELMFTVESLAQPPEPQQVYITGNHTTLATWDPAAVPMLHLHARTWRLAVRVPAATRTEYKYTRGGWPTVEVAANLSDVPNRLLDVQQPTAVVDQVPAWADERP